MANISSPRLRPVVDKNAEPADVENVVTTSGKETIDMSQLDDLFLKIDHLQSTVSNMAMDMLQLKNSQEFQKENNQKFWAQDWPTIIKGQNSLQDKCNSIEREVSELKPLMKQIVDHEQRLRDVEKSVIKMGVMASFIGAAFGVIVTWVIKFIKIGS